MADVQTAHVGANALIDQLREMALAVRVLGEENLKLDAECDQLQRDADDASERAGWLEQRLTELEGDRDDAVGLLRNAIADFGRGIITRDELLRRSGWADQADACYLGGRNEGVGANDDA